ncbi:MAG: hypothetical protein D6769_03725 [Methanobacteriota archaeon]|nr:MAG: hypothetical protein D6769_03725 [Euryarchaeota archaeon]
MVERITTGIDGLDEMLQGGIPKNRHVAIFGGPGTGKTTLGMQFLYHGAQKGEKGLYVSLEEPPEQIIENVKAVFPSWSSNIDSMISNSSLFIKKPEHYTLDSLIETTESTIVDSNVTRLVIDSSTVVEAFFATKEEYRKNIVEFMNLLKTLDASVLFLVEAHSAEMDITYKLEHYIMDGIINVYNLQRGSSRVRALEVYKMRATNHSPNLVPLRITPEGIKVFPTEKVL